MPFKPSARVANAARALVLALAAGAALPAHSQPTDAFTPRLTTPRLAPVKPEDRTPAQKAMLEKRADANIFKTLAHHPGFYMGAWTPLAGYLFNGSTLPPREREIVMLRMGWLCQSEYEWAQHARIAKSVGVTEAEVQRIALGPDAAGWSDFDRALLRMAHEVRYDGMVSDATWKALRTKYSDQEVVESMLTAAQYLQVSMVLNSLGIQLDPDLDDRLPRNLKLPALAARPASPRLSTPRIKALMQADMTPQQRELVKPQTSDGVVPHLYATLASYPKLYGPYLAFDTYMQRDGLIPAKARELLSLRTAWNLRDAYGWAHHAMAAKAAGLTEAEVARIAKGSSASGWSEAQAALLSAADQLHREAFIPDATWLVLAKHYNMQQLVEIICTVGMHALASAANNSIGVQLEPGMPAMPSG